MPQENWVVLEQVSGSAVAEMLKGLLEAQGLEVLLSQEGIGGWAIPVVVGPLGEIQVLVKEDQLEQAQQVMVSYHAGLFENVDYSTDSEEDQPADDPG